MQGDPNTGLVVCHRLAAITIKHHWRSCIITQEQPVIRLARITNHQPWRIGIACQIVDIDFAGAHQLADQRQDQKPVSPRCHPKPVI